jgi:hypothetical protein
MGTAQMSSAVQTAGNQSVVHYSNQFRPLEIRSAGGVLIQMSDEE